MNINTIRYVFIIAIVLLVLGVICTDLGKWDKNFYLDIAGSIFIGLTLMLLVSDAIFFLFKIIIK